MLPLQPPTVQLLKKKLAPPKPKIAHVCICVYTVPLVVINVPYNIIMLTQSK